MDLLDSVGDFTNIGLELFFIETSVGNFVYNRLENTMSRYDGSYFSYLSRNRITKTKYRGKHKLRDYCGDNIRIM